MSLIDPPSLPIYIPKGTPIFKCTSPRCGFEGTEKQVSDHHRQEHVGLPPKK